MKPLKRLLPLLALFLFVCLCFTACELLDVQQIDEPASTRTETTDEGGQPEMTTDRPDETEDGTAAPETTAPTTTAAATAPATTAAATAPSTTAETPATTEAPQDEPPIYEYPMDRVTPLNGTIVTSSNKYAVMKNYLGAVIDLEEISYDVVTITRDPAVSEMGYAFLTALPVDKEVPSYAKGYDMVIWDENDTATLFIPEDARYLYVYYYDSGVYYLPESVVFSYATVPTTFTVASWNIGHYSMGGSKNTKLTDDQYATEKAKYDAYIDSLGADILILNEYSKMFTPKNAARYLFLDYGCPFEGEQRNYSCNALYAKLPLKNVTLREFACNTPDTVLHTTVIKATDYYYITGELTVDGKTVTIVGLHLAFNDNLHPNDTVCTAQMDELIATFANTERVVILGDWNAYNAEYYERFAEAGYTVANDGSYLTCTGSRTGGLEWPVDNIIVKGVTMTDFHVVNTSLSDHIAVVATITLE